MAALLTTLDSRVHCYGVADCWWCDGPQLLQDYGEVVAMTGSSANYHNIRIFLAADASLAMEPLYPQVRGAKVPGLWVPRTQRFFLLFCKGLHCFGLLVLCIEFSIL